MKPFLVLLMATMFLPLVPATHAQASSPAADGPIHLLDDAAKDVKADVAGQVQDTQGRWAATDLRSLAALETPESITLILGVAALPPSGPSTSEAAFVEDAHYFVSFRQHDQVYRVNLERRIFFGSAHVDGELEAYNPARHGYDQVGRSQEGQVDPSAGTITFVVDRELIVDRSGDAPHPEVPLTDWRVESRSDPAFASSDRPFCFIPGTPCMGFPSVHDRMPDQGNGTLAMTVRHGVSQTGHARLSSLSATRASNGEATTIVFEVEAHNRGAANESFALGATGVPAGWSVRLPAQRITIPAASSVLLPVLLAVPFTHQHGTYQHFLVEMRSLADSASVGRIQLGIRYTNPPQPAGHHSTLWLHTTPQESFTGTAADVFFYGAGEPYMNALEPQADPFDAKGEVPSRQCSLTSSGTTGQIPQTTYCWDVPLSPQLELGLDFDLSRVGELSFPVKALMPQLGTRLGGSILYFPGSDDGLGRTSPIRVATLRSAGPVDLPPNTKDLILKADVVPTAEGDYVQYSKGASLSLRIELTSAVPQVITFGANAGWTPVLQPGGILHLPLDEYHDPVAKVFASNSTLALLAAGPQDRQVNPGKAALFNLTLQNNGPAGTFTLDLSGTHLAWTRLLAPGRSIRLGAGESVPVRVAVQVPDAADKGDTADLVLSATSAADLNVRALARLYAAVDTATPHPDDTPLLGLAQGEHKAPGPGFLAGTALLVAMAFLGRRRSR